MEKMEDEWGLGDVRAWDEGSRVVLLVFACIGELLAAFGLFSSIFVVNGQQNIASPTVWIGLLLLFPTLVILSFRRSPWARITCMLLAVATFFLLGFSTLFGRSYYKPMTFSSPDGAYEVTVREWSVVKGSGADLTFRKKGKLFASETVRVVYTGEYISPFSDGDYEVIWNGNAVTIRYIDRGEKTVFFWFKE